MRKPLNSHTLREANKTLYRSFFVNYSTIISSAGGAILAGTFTDHVGGPGLHQKVPLRNYLGIDIIDNSEEIIFENFGTYDYYENCFSLLDIRLENIDKLRLLRKKISESLGKPIGLRVGVLNEIPRRTGLNNPGANASNLCFAYLLLTRQIDLTDIERFQNLDVNLETETLELIKKNAIEFHSAWLGRKNAGFGVFSSMVNRSDILVYNPGVRFPVMGLSDIFRPDINRELPLDIVIIGTSDRYDIDFSLREYDEVTNIFSISDKEVVKFETAFGSKNFIGKDFPTMIRNTYFSAVSATGLSSVIALGKFIQNPNMENQKICLQLLNSSYDLINLFGQNFSRKNKVHALITKYFYESQPDMPFALGTGLTNNLLMVTPKDSSRKLLLEVDKYLKSKLNYDISYPYISWSDENDTNGAVVEKFKAEKVTPSYIPQNCLYLFTVNNMENKYSIEAIDSTENLEAEVDILLDVDNKKIFIKGKKVTSKELPTVAATLNLISQLTENNGFTVGSNYLPALSYFQDRNELQSKIISPLCILVEKQLGKHLNLKINGTLTEYTISLFPSDVKMGIIKRF